MKVFRNEVTARKSFKEKQELFLNSCCPYVEWEKLCGNWCALFYLDKGGENTTPYVILGCKAGEKYLYVETIVEEVSVNE